MRAEGCLCAASRAGCDVGVGGDKVTPAPCGAEQVGRQLMCSQMQGRIQAGLSAAVINAMLSLMLCSR